MKVSPELSTDESLRYARHISIPDIGSEGQRKLKAASVLLVGCGGLGSALALYLAAAGVGHIGLVDADRVELSNLQRQVIHDTPGLGELKVHSAQKRILALNPLINVNVYPLRLTSANAVEISRGYDLLLDGCDNFATRYLLNDLAVSSRRVYIYGAVQHFEGQVSVFDARRGPCYRCIFPENSGDTNENAPTGKGVFGILPGIIGSLQAAEAIKVITGAGTPLYGRLLIYDGLEGSFQTIKLHARENCAVCGSPKQNHNHSTHLSERNL